MSDSVLRVDIHGSFLTPSVIELQAGTDSSRQLRTQALGTQSKPQGTRSASRELIPRWEHSMKSHRTLRRSTLITVRILRDQLTILWCKKHISVGHELWQLDISLIVAGVGTLNLTRYAVITASTRVNLSSEMR